MYTSKICAVVTLVAQSLFATNIHVSHQLTHSKLQEGPAKKKKKEKSCKDLFVQRFYLCGFTSLDAKSCFFLLSLKVSDV